MKEFFLHQKNGTTIYLTVTTSSVLVSVDNTLGEYVLTIAPVDTHKPSSQLVADTSSSSRSTSKTASTSALYWSAALFNCNHIICSGVSG